MIEPNISPRNSPALNLLDYVIWDALQQIGYRQRSFASFDELKGAIINA